MYVLRLLFTGTSERERYMYEVLIYGLGERGATIVLKYHVGFRVCTHELPKLVVESCVYQIIQVVNWSLHQSVHSLVGGSFRKNSESVSFL